MTSMILLDSLDFWVQFTRHLAHPSELTFWEWVLIISLVYNFITWTVLICIGMDRYEKTHTTPRNVWW